MKKMVIALIAMAFLAVGTLAMAEGPAQMTFEGGKMGQVAFDHAAHQGKVADCATCHHKGLESGKCTGCHGSDPAAPKSKDAFHKQCKDCHKDMGGPTGCKDCHKK